MFCDHKKSYLDLKFISDKKKSTGTQNLTAQ